MSIKITPDKYPRIIEVYNTEGKTAAYDLMRSCYEIKNPSKSIAPINESIPPENMHNLS